jgi:hypothetical protein
MEASREEAKATQEKTKAILEEIKAAVKTGLGDVKARDLEANSEETNAIVARRKVPNEEAAVEAIGALEDRYGDRRLAVGCRRQPKKWVPAEAGRPPRTVHPRAVPALRKGRILRGLIRQAAAVSEDEAGGRRQETSLGRVKTLYEALGQTLELEVVKLAVGVSIRLRKMCDWTLWRGWPPPKLNKRRQKHSPRKRRNGDKPVD